MITAKRAWRPDSSELTRSLNGYFVARSTDDGRTWTEGREIDSRLYHNLAGLTRILELPSRMLLPTANGRYGTHAMDMTGERLALPKTGIFEHVFRSSAGGKTWVERDVLANHATETRLLRLPSGKLFVRFGRNPRLTTNA